MGTKCLHVFRRSTSSEILEALFRERRGIHFEYDSELERDARQINLNENGAVYIPRLWLHWVQNGPEISVSLSLNFFTPPNFAMECLQYE